MPKTPVCPGCEIGCTLDKVRCSRGFGLVARYAARKERSQEACGSEQREASRGPVGTGGGFRGSAAAYLASSGGAPAPGSHV